MTSTRIASGHGLATVAADGTVLDTWFPAPVLAPLAENESAALQQSLQQAAGEDNARGVALQVVSVEADLDAQAQSTPDVWLRLHLLSHRMARPTASI